MSINLNQIPEFDPAKKLAVWQKALIARTKKKVISWFRRTASYLRELNK